MADMVYNVSFFYLHSYYGDILYVFYKYIILLQYLHIVSIVMKYIFVSQRSVQYRLLTNAALLLVSIYSAKLANYLCSLSSRFKNRTKLTCKISDG